MIVLLKFDLGKNISEIEDLNGVTEIDHSNDFSGHIPTEGCQVGKVDGGFTVHGAAFFLAGGGRAPVYSVDVHCVIDAVAVPVPFYDLLATCYAGGQWIVKGYYWMKLKLTNGLDKIVRCVVHIDVLV